MLLRRVLRPGLLALGLFALLTSTVAHADTVTFASFKPNGKLPPDPNATPANPFTYTSTGIGGAGGLASFSTATIPVDFSFAAGNAFTNAIPAAVLGLQDARLTMTANSEQKVVVAFGLAFQQHMYGTLEIRRATPYLGKDLLLKVEFGRSSDTNSGGLYFGVPNGSTSSLSADQRNNDYVNFSSDFIDFTSLGAIDENMSLTFTSVNPGLIVDNISKFFKDHTATGTGSFAATASAPEPATIACALMGAAFAGIGVIRRRNAKS